MKSVGCSGGVLKVLWDLSHHWKAFSLWEISVASPPRGIIGKRRGQDIPILQKPGTLLASRRSSTGMRRFGKHLLGLHSLFCFSGSDFHTHCCASCVFQGGSCAKTVCARRVKFGKYFTLAKIIFSSLVESKSLEDSVSCASLVF